MISIMDSTTEQASELGMSFYFHLNKQPNLVYALSTFYTPLVGGVLPFVCHNRTPLLSSSGLTEEKLSTGFQQLLFKDSLASYLGQ